MPALYTDGSCHPNPGPGGWAWVELGRSHELLRYGVGFDCSTTNNRMELTALGGAVERAAELVAPVEIHCDSQYAIGCLTRWGPGWRKKKWRDVKNADIIRPIYELYRQLDHVTILWTRGHQGLIGNELADRLSGLARIHQRPLTTKEVRLPTVRLRITPETSHILSRLTTPYTH